jgi:hypothetical protein
VQHQEKEPAGNDSYEHGRPFVPVVHDPQGPGDPGQREKDHDQEPSKGSDWIVSGRRMVLMQRDNRRTADKEHRCGYLPESHSLPGARNTRSIGYFKRRV